MPQLFVDHRSNMFETLRQRTMEDLHEAGLLSPTLEAISFHFRSTVKGASVHLWHCPVTNTFLARSRHFTYAKEGTRAVCIANFCHFGSLYEYRTTRKGFHHHCDAVRGINSLRRTVRLDRARRRNCCCNSHRQCSRPQQCDTLFVASTCPCLGEPTSTKNASQCTRAYFFCYVLLRND